MLADRQVLNIHDCAVQLVNGQIPCKYHSLHLFLCQRLISFFQYVVVSGDVPEIISKYRTSTGRIMTAEESRLRYGQTTYNQKSSFDTHGCELDKVG